MQCTSFLPGCYSTRNLRVGANGGTWASYNNDTTLKSGYSYNVFLPPPATDQYLGYDKEILRQTMLKHEATFRDQVQALHRLYRRQRELMDEIRRRELYKNQRQLQTSQSNPFLSQNSSEYPKSAWHVPSLPWVNPAGSRPSILGSENCQAALTFNELKSMQTGFYPAQTEDGSKDGCRKSKKRMLDLELPADEYIDSEGEGFGEEKVSEVPCCPPTRMSEALPKSDFPCSGAFNSILQGGSSSSDLFSRKTNDLADLNEPAQLEDAEIPNSVTNILGSDTYHREIPRWDYDLSEKSTSGFQVSPKEIAPSIHTRRDVEAFSKFIHLAKDTQRELLLHNDEDVQSRSNLNTLPQISSPGKLPTPSKPLKVELLAVPASVNLLDKCDRKLCSEKTIFSLETSERNHDLSNENNPGLVNSCIPSSSNQLALQSDLAKSELSSLSYRIKPMCYLRQNPTAVQALPCFNVPVSKDSNSKSSEGSPGLNGNMFHLSRNLRCSPSVGSISPLENSFCLGSQSDSRAFDAFPTSISINHNANDSASELHKHTKCFHGSDGKDVNSAKTLDLNFMPPNGVKKIEDFLEGLPWLRAKPDCNGKLNKEREDLTQMDSGSSQAFPTSICYVEGKRLETSDCTSGEKILFSSNFDKPHVSCSKPSEDKDMENSEKVGVPAIELGKQCSKDDLVMKMGVDNEFSGVGNHIDLNSCINEDESSPTHTVPSMIVKTLTEIDLEAPVSPENKECSPPRRESEENQLETPPQMSKQEHGNPQEELVRMAAEAIVLISSSGFQKLFLETACVVSESSHSDSLHWFAGIVSSLASDLDQDGIVLRGDGGGDHRELLSDVSDYFEIMTLMLTETKLEEYCCKSNGQKEEETGAILSQNQPRRGRTRRGRQQKDFETVLPCLASLSRHEVTEDIQIIGGLMEAVGTPLETGLGRRNAVRNGGARVRRSSISPSNVVESTVSSSVKQQSNDISELASVEISLTGWGKTNRRRRGPRLPASKCLNFSC
ncbi:hypothetical protein F0562_024863 [Nyssa sinensis]|uniref:Uncharacterized protein n=1 Tax=Nyssa sinensis TaxID=561372 RepID=A0A5J5BE34_9ASTE|nr:hypothetical protein F0562_024863 [Nyssa sinensis]